MIKIEMYQKRMELRPCKEKEAEQKIENAYGDKYSWLLMVDSRREVSVKLDQYSEEREIERKIRQEQIEKAQQLSEQTPKRKRKEQDWAR